MCFFTASTLSIEQIARRSGLGVDVVNKLKKYLAEQEKLFVSEQQMLPPAKRKRPKFFDFHIADKVYYAPAYSKPQTVIVGPSRQLQVMRWGLKPRNVSPEKMEQYAKENWFVNANGERIFEDKTFPYYLLIQSHTTKSGEHFPAQRCLIPSTGFIEYHYFSDKDKQPYFIEFPDRPEFMMAGLYEVTPIPGKTGVPGGGLDLDNPDFENYYYTYVQLTTGGTEQMKKLHNGGNNPFRMPLVLREHDEALWLNPETPTETIKSLIKPYDEYPIKAWPIDKNFQKMNPLTKETVQKIDIQEKLDL